MAVRARAHVGQDHDAVASGGVTASGQRPDAPWLGDMVEIGDAVMYHGDCRDIMPTLIGVDALVSDPQYADIDTDSTRFSGGNRRIGDGRDDWGVMHGAREVFDPVPWLEYPIVVLWGYHHFANKLPVGTIFVWNKRHIDAGTFLSDAELAWFNLGHGVYVCELPWGNLNIISENNGAYDKAHPHQKPIRLMEWTLDKAKVPAGATVLDPHAGSGTTGVACVRTGRKFIGIESNRRFFDAACERLDWAQRQQSFDFDAGS